MAVDFNFSGMATGNNANLFDTVISAAGFGNSSAVAAQFGQAVPNVLGIFDFASNMIMNSNFRSDVGTGMELRYADNNSFYQTAMSSVKFTTPSVPGFPGANVFFQCPMGLITASPSLDLTGNNNTNWFFPLSTTDLPQDPRTLIKFASGVTFVGEWFGQQRSMPLYFTTVTSSTAIANTATQTAFDRSYVLPAYILNFQGAQLRIATAGRLSTTGSPTLNLRIKFGALEIGRFPFTTFANSNFQPFQANISAKVATVGASNAFLMGSCWANIGGGNGRTSEVTGVQGFNPTIANTITVTAQWGTASPSNSVILDDLTVDVVYPGAVQ